MLARPGVFGQDFHFGVVDMVVIPLWRSTTSVHPSAAYIDGFESVRASRVRIRRI